MSQVFAVYFEAGGKAQYVMGRGGKAAAYTRDEAHRVHADCQAKALSNASIIDYSDVPPTARVRGT